MREKNPGGSNPDFESSKNGSGRDDSDFESSKNGSGQDDSGQIDAISFHLNFPVFLLNHYLGGKDV